MEEIRENELRRILQLIPSGVGVYDVTGGVVCKAYLNDGYFQMIGAKREDRHRYDGTSTVDAVLPEDQPGLLREAVGAIRENRMLCYRFRVLGGNGEYRWVAIQANHVSVGEGTERFYASYYDIDELMRTQQKLRSDELLFRNSLKYSEIVHFNYFPQTHCYETVVVPEKLDFLPRTMENFPESFIELAGLGEKDAAAYREMTAKIDAGAQEAECTVQTRFGGNSSWQRVHLWNFLNAEGETQRAVGNSVDVSRYKEAERTLREERLRMESLKSGLLAASCFNVSQDVNIELNNGVNLNYREPENAAIRTEALEADPENASQNPETLKVLLAAAERIPDKKQRLRFLRTCSNVGMKRLYEAGQREITFEYRRWTGRGLIWVSTRVALLRDPETGDILAFYFTSDVNDRVIYRKITGEVLSRNYETVSYYDVHAGKLYLRESEISFAPMDYGLAVENAIERFVLPEEAETTKEKYRMENVLAELEKGPVYSIYYTGKERDNTLPENPHKRMKSDLFYLDEDRDVIVFLQSNITAIYELERENQEKMAAAMREAESANRAKTEFLSRISHDIRTPISIISSMTDFAFADLHDEEKLKNDLEKIKSADIFLLSLINDVLDISKIDSGSIQLTPTPYPYEEHSANTRSVLETMCEEKGLRHVFERRRKTGVIVADRVRLNQIILNVISNAVKYTPPGGTVAYISDSENLPDAKIRFGFEIRDTGIGMSEEFQKRMFEPFTQEYDNPARPKGITGTGLGLSIVKRMVDLMGGKLSVTSRLGQGTTVVCSIVFPDAERDPRWRDWQEPMPRAEEEKGVLSGKILLCEDNPINAEIAVRILESFGLDCERAENGAVGVEKFEASAPGEYCAVLMDIQMPLLNGYEATRRIRAMDRPDAGSIPIIAMTADAFTDAMERGFQVGMNEYLLKPLDPKRLRSALQKAIGKKK